MSNSLSQLSNFPVLGGIAEQASSVSPVDEIGERFVAAYRISEVLMHATLIPDHLRGERKNVGGSWQMVPFTPDQIRANVMMVVNRALQWKVDPVALIAESFVVGGKLDFQGKVIIAVVNKLGGLQGNLKFEYSGKGDTLTVTVIGQLKGEASPRTVDLSFKDAVTKDKQGKVNEQWTKDVESKLAYSGAKKWARRHTPEVVLGLFGEEDDDRTDAMSPVIEASSKPTPAIESKPWQDTLVGRYEVRINEVADRPALQRLVDKIKSEPDAVLAKDEKDYLVSMAKMVWLRKPGSEPEQEEVQSVNDSAASDDSQNQDPALDDRVLHYEAMITEADSPESLEKWIVAIDADEVLPIAYKKSLGKFANERQRAGFAVAK
jgi:hypothetical protein